jgi:hypothetical protein
MARGFDCRFDKITPRTTNVTHPTMPWMHASYEDGERQKFQSRSPNFSLCDLCENLCGLCVELALFNAENAEISQRAA